jgi:hypothetical protein
MKTAALGAVFIAFCLQLSKSKPLVAQNLPVLLAKQRVFDAGGDRVKDQFKVGETFLTDSVYSVTVLRTVRSRPNVRPACEPGT